MKGMIAYKPQTSKTGKLLKQLLTVKRKKTQKRARLNYFLRWGNSDTYPIRTQLELNSLQSVRNTTNKLRMLTILFEAGIPVPEFSTTVNDSNDYYIRSKTGVTRYGNDFSPELDSYVTKPIENKRREYRVHVFNSKIIAIYEKIPLDQENKPKLYKSHNCHFKLMNPEISRCDWTGQLISINAVNSLGLLFGGVDLIRRRDGSFVVTEVNTAPGLNSSNAQRWVAAIKEYINDNTSNE